MTFFGILDVSLFVVSKNVVEVCFCTCKLEKNYLLPLVFISDAKTWEEANVHLGSLYSESPPIEDFFIWRDLR